MSSVTTPARNHWQGIDVKAALVAGLIAGVVDEALLVAGLVLQGAGFWTASRMTAAIVMGAGVLPPPATFDLAVIVVATIVHFGLSVIYALIIAWFVRNSGWNAGLLIGVAAGFAIYVFNFYLVAPLVFPWWIEMRGLVPTLIHPVFGVTAAAAYMWLRKTPASARPV